ncbi:MAG: hypothetical protein ACTSV2_17015 [Candidatus Thorarchaeota archaeon]
MKRALQLILALTIVSIFMISPVAAATSQGFEWGFATGDRFDFTISDSETDLNEGIYLNITAMPAAAIADPITTWFTIPQPTGGTYFDNGTVVPSMYTAFLILLLFINGKMAVPIGNFTLLQELAAGEMTGEEFVDTTTVWGIEYTFAQNATHDYKITNTFSKTDGFLAEFSFEFLLSADDSVLESFSLVRDAVPSLDIVQLLQDNIILVAAGVGVLIVLAIVCKKK